MNNFVTIRNLTFKRRNRIIFDDVNFDIPKGKITAIMGPSGSGKTTLLKLIGGQLYPQIGTVEVDHQNVHKLSRNKLYQLRRKMGLLFQRGALFTNISVFDNVAFPIREHTNLNEAMIRDLVLMKLEFVGLRNAHQLMPSQLSGGMERRVALARAIALDPQMIMYDEPFTGQDPISMGVLVKLIKELNDSLETTSIIVSHDVAEASSIADYIYLIANGKVIGQGTPEELNKTKSPHVMQFLKGLPDGPVPFHYPGKTLEDDLQLL
ncbi:MAG: ATP-binding cassette domain-containing protein [Gammaproteobacteria bacterium]|nr:ATP-binding cassette domain-containing protein [Gammaproteobacteria bacterium]